MKQRGKSKMARAKTSTKKTASKSSSSKKSFNLGSWVSNNRMWLFVLVFSVLGTYFLVSTYANPKLPTYSDDIVAGYISLTPTAVNQDESGNLTYEMYPMTAYVQVDGTVVCDSGGSNGTVTTGTLSNGEVKKLHKDMYDTGVTGLADEIGFGANDAFASYEGVLVGEETEAKGTAVYGDAARPDSFTKAKQKLAKACEKATTAQKRETVRGPREPKVKNSGNKKTAFFGLEEVLFPTASACCNAGTRQTAMEIGTGGFEPEINKYRASVGRAALAQNACLRDRAAIWSDKMAAAGKISHSTTFGQDAAACYPNWRKAGENVGVGYDVAGLMRAFKASPAHNANMLDPAYKAFGVGVVKKTNDSRIFVTQRFVAL